MHNKRTRNLNSKCFCVRVRTLFMRHGTSEQVLLNSKVDRDPLNYSNLKTFSYYLVIKRRKLSLTPLKELEVVAGTEPMLIAKKYPSTTCDQIIRLIQM